MPELVQNEVLPTDRSATSLLDRLKIETLSIHQRLEQDLDLVGPCLSQASYLRTLKAFYGFYKPFEEYVYANLPNEIAPVFAPRKKTPRLAEDLRYFDVQPEAVRLCKSLPELNTLARLLGSLYVIEGATLGGQLIARHLQLALQLQNGFGYSFFSGYGSETGSMWKTFRTCLLRYSSASMDDGIVQGAQRTFEAMHRWLCPERLPL